MKFDYKFSNLIGASYQNGNVLFTPEDCLISAVRNKISISNIKDHISQTLAVECKHNISALALDCTGCFLLVVDDDGHGFYINLRTQTVLCRCKFNKPVASVTFSPDGRRFVVTGGCAVQVYRTPDVTSGKYNALYLENVFHVAQDSTSCADWSADSRLFAVGSKDMQTRICSPVRYENFFVYSVGGHSSSVVACFFSRDNFDLFTLDKSGFLVCWECGISSDQLRPCVPRKDVRDDADVDDANDAETTSEKHGTFSGIKDPLFYKKLKRHSFHDAVQGSSVYLMCAAFNKKSGLLATGFSNGAFALHELPDFNLIQVLSISTSPLTAVGFNSSGEWISVGCAALRQLLVWEWQSETYVLKQQSHMQSTSCLAYSADSQFIATGGLDGKVKVWNAANGFCFVTFSEHTGCITEVTWFQAGRALLTCSLDGTVRAFDLKRYRNFRTLTAPTITQFSCLSIDQSGDIVCAGSTDVFDIFVWSMQTGKLLDILSGHEAPVSDLCFNPKTTVLATSSWDKTLRIWDVFESKGQSEAIQLDADALCVKFSPDGDLVAVATLDCQISFHEWKNKVQVSTIEGRLDLDPGRAERDVITAKTSGLSKSFTTFCFTADGDYVIAAGQSRFVCIYHVREALLVKKFQITCNLSLDAIADDIDRRKMSEFGYLGAASISDSDNEDGQTSSKLKLPGVAVGNFSERSAKPEVRVTCVQFSSTGRSWAACTTEGLLLYSLDKTQLFNPFQLATDVTPDLIRAAAQAKDYNKALLMSLRLNNEDLITEVVEQIPHEKVNFICRALPDVFVNRLLEFVGGSQIQKSQKYELYLSWIHSLLTNHGAKLKQRANTIMTQLSAVQHNLTKKHEDISKVCDHGRYSIRYILDAMSLQATKPEEDIEVDTEI